MKTTDLDLDFEEAERFSKWLTDNGVSLVDFFAAEKIHGKTMFLEVFYENLYLFRRGEKINKLLWKNGKS